MLLASPISEWNRRTSTFAELLLVVSLDENMFIDSLSVSRLMSDFGITPG
jgi:hypothetical protein